MRQWLIILTAAALALLAVTGFGPLLLGGSMRGWAMIIHCAAAPVFAVCLTVYAVGHAERHVRSVTFWAMVTLAAAAIATATAGLTPWFSTDCQRVLYAVHTYAAGTLIVASLVHAARSGL